MPLGKSLDNILGDYFGETEINLSPVNQDGSSTTLLKEKSLGIEEIKLELISLSPYQTRTKFDQEKIATLAQDIKTQGLIQPIIVLKKKFTNTTTPEYILLAGERRLRAARKLGWQTILAVIKTEEQLNEKQQAMISAMENLQREDLSAIELAQTFKMLMLTQKIDEVELAEIIGNSVQYIKNYLRLLNLSTPVKEALLNKTIGEGQARHLVPLSEDEQLLVLEEIIEKQLTVKEIIEYIKNLKAIKKTKILKKSLLHKLPEEIIIKADRFASQFPNAKLKCQGDLEKGKIIISWENKK